eukprot:1182381-Prorocentrum_minimum.AAC.3
MGTYVSQHEQVYATTVADGSSEVSTDGSADGSSEGSSVAQHKCIGGVPLTTNFPRLSEFHGTRHFRHTCTVTVQPVMIMIVARRAPLSLGGRRSTSIGVTLHPG